MCLFLETGEGREKERERNINVLEKHQSAASNTPPTQACALSGIKPATFQFADDAQPTESHQSGLR